MANDIGITFMPSADAQADGPQNMADNGPGGRDLADAFKILSLRLPQTVGPRSLASQRLLTARGSAGAPSGFNPHAAVFEALLRSILGGGPAPTLPNVTRGPFQVGQPGGGASGGSRTGSDAYGAHVTPGTYGTEPTPKIPDAITLTPHVTPGTTPEAGVPAAGRPDRDTPTRRGY